MVDKATAIYWLRELIAAVLLDCDCSGQCRHQAARDTIDEIRDAGLLESGKPED